MRHTLITLSQARARMFDLSKVETTGTMPDVPWLSSYKLNIHFFKNYNNIVNVDNFTYDVMTMMYIYILLIIVLMIKYYNKILRNILPV